MNKFFKGLIECKLSACAMFTAAMFLYLCFCLVYDNREVSTALLWGLFWVSVAGALIQAVCFSDWIIKKMRYTWPGKQNGSRRIRQEHGACLSVSFSSSSWL